MKKFLLALFMTLMVSATCFAEGAASRFNTEEKAADALVAALVGNGTYEQVSKSFTGALREKVNAETFATVKNEIKKQVGNVKNVNFVILTKQYDLQKGYSGIDELVYVGTVSKDKFARIFVAFGLENGAPKINGFQVSPVSIEPQKQEAPAKN